MAELVNRITQLLADKRWHWNMLDALHLQLHARLVSNALQPSDFVVIRDQNTQRAVGVQRGRVRGPARLLPLARCRAQCTQGLRHAVRSRCDSKCGTTHATQMQLASFPYAGSPSAEAVAELSGCRLRRAAMQAACSSHGPGSGSLGCNCRVALLENLSGSAKWPVALLDSTPSAAPIELAAQQTRCQRRRCVIAQVCGPNHTAALTNGMRLYTKWRDEDQGCGFFLDVAADQKPCRKQFALGYAPRSSIAIAQLSATAQEWANGKHAWHGEIGSEVRYLASNYNWLIVPSRQAPPTLAVFTVRY